MLRHLQRAFSVVDSGGIGEAQVSELALSITADNGKEFAYHELLAKSLECDVCFAHPHSSWERGLNEYKNVRLRQYFQKNTNFNEVTDSEVANAIKMLKDKPRKLLDFKTPAYLMQQQMVALVICLIMRFKIELTVFLGEDRIVLQRNQKYESNENQSRQTYSVLGNL